MEWFPSCEVTFIHDIRKYITDRFTVLYVKEAKHGWQPVFVYFDLNGGDLKPDVFMGV